MNFKSNVKQLLQRIFSMKFKKLSVTAQRPLRIYENEDFNNSMSII